jgi:uncharacterized protein (DUF1330 family)
MSVFFLAEIEVLDPEKYQEYVDRAFKIVQKFGGEYIFRSSSIVPVSGDWKPQRMILIRFESEAQMHGCFGSEAYRRIEHLREQSTRSRAVVIMNGCETDRDSRHEGSATETCEPEYSVWRQDDHGNVFLVKDRLTETEAFRLVREFENKGHKQTYWVKEIP